ncbi:acyltransferase [Mesorhizobium sp. M7A.F.Ca.CA.001.09.2.1]|uniref:Acyltransferase n=5 Tax=Mesorhizobium TaxID=68287 RepID=A0AB38TC92_9HYPH|nr:MULTISPECIES: acyltransferase [Mesorhizobium]RUY49850.1 acyltransferase [Mesorhizobium sp. M7A.F.Ca.CA.001.13.2.1]RUZ89884.1 acyltransferase [Mesorhizobium sp. M7A.F.Ca.US.003.02.2.1]RVA56106.1 acyltransferase [Mesorhizobium sp. M7A.F.Ca.US.001.01.1.1]AMX96401.1 hypothetical protein A4R28_27120 [Mesorhizobium ciceri]AMX98469.1 hypothetical protein A4R29_02240 [Mesorhizobium ciceri biovar biserrulae]
MTVASTVGVESPTVLPDSTNVRRKLLGLQVLRFVAAFAVVLFHIGSGFQIEFGLKENIFGFGASGVDIFFVISGFIIAYTTDEAKGAWQFCRRRIVRIVPLYWTLTAGIVLIALMKPGLLNSTVVSGETILKSLFFIPFEKVDGSIQPLLFLGWSLNYEMFFYAIYAACIACGLRGPLSPSMFIVVLVAMGQFIQSENVAWRFYTNPLMLEFVFGILLYLAYVHSAKLFVGRTWLMLAIFVATIAIRQMIPDLPWLLANGVPAVVLTAAALSWSPPRTRAITFLVLLGDASYSLYLSHPYVIQLASKLLPHQSGLMAQGLAGIVACALSIAVSIVLYTMIERPAQALFNGLAARRQASSTLRKTENHI